MRLSPEPRILNAAFSTTPVTILAYSLPFVKRHGVRFRQAFRRKRKPRTHHAAELHGEGCVDRRDIHALVCHAAIFGYERSGRDKEEG